MRRRSLLTVILVLACSRQETEERGPSEAQSHTEQAQPTSALDEQLAAEAAGGLANALGSVGLTPRVDGNRVVVDERELEVHVEIEESLVHEGRHVLAAAFSLRLDGRELPAFTSGVVGIGGDDADAREATLLEWTAEYGAPIAFAVAKREFPGQFEEPGEAEVGAPFYAPMQIDGVAGFSSVVGLRGRVADPGTLTSNEHTRELAEVAARYASSGPGYHTLTIQVSVGTSGAVDADCRVDGVESVELSRAIAALDWPPGISAYIYKQFFVLLDRP